ncbi:MAG: PTS sugar transporter subunit IIA [Lachnospiraceae bacterium]|nr:PTS sugar transporter subunit IIA [Lachnospiraceae bacterium]
MIRYLIVTHGPLAEAFRESAGMFFGDAAEEIDAVGLYPEDSVDALKDRITQVIRQRYSQEGIVLFVDVFAGSPFNMAALALEELKGTYPKLECFTGVNLPVLLEALAGADSMSLAQMSRRIEELAPATIVNVKKALDM